VCIAAWNFSTTPADRAADLSTRKTVASRGAHGLVIVAQSFRVRRADVTAGRVDVCSGASFEICILRRKAPICLSRHHFSSFVRVCVCVCALCEAETPATANLRIWKKEGREGMGGRGPGERRLDTRGHVDV
jgi:hypothetical protein